MAGIRLIQIIKGGVQFGKELLNGRKPYPKIVSPLELEQVDPRTFRLLQIAGEISPLLKYHKAGIFGGIACATTTALMEKEQFITRPQDQLTVLVPRYNLDLVKQELVNAGYSEEDLNLVWYTEEMDGRFLRMQGVMNGIRYPSPFIDIFDTNFMGEQLTVADPRLALLLAGVYKTDSQMSDYDNYRDIVGNDPQYNELEDLNPQFLPFNN